MWIEPVSVVYPAPAGESARFYGWWGNMDFGSHLIKTLAAKRQGRVDLMYHPPLRVSDFENRKALALKTESLVREGHRKMTLDQIDIEHR
jgi:1-acyl-sn-glycerol-3-phosphate acyltransferase